MSIIKILIKNIRPYRTIHYLGLVIGGSLIGYWLLANNIGFILGYGLPVFVVALAVVFAFQAACVINDFFDVKGDRITNPKRPLVLREINVNTYRKWGLISLFISLLLSAAVGWFAFGSVALFIILYTLYSVPPLRLKKYFPVNTAVVAVNGLIAMVAGFSVVAGKKTIFLFPVRIAIMVMVAFLTAVNMIHIKDREADITFGIRTIPTMMSERGARIIIAVLTVVAYFSVPMILGIKALIYPSILCAGLGTFWVLRKKWHEGPYFITYFAYYGVMLYFLRDTFSRGG